MEPSLPEEKEIKMVTVECQECPIRNFCPVFQLQKENVHYTNCPILLSTRNEFTSKDANLRLEEERKRDGHQG